MAPMWEVVGGKDKGGILVREGQALTSEALQERLSTGSEVEELELIGDRLRYRRLCGTGPELGWVSVRMSGKELMARKAPKAAAVEDPGDEYIFLNGSSTATEKTPWLKAIGKPKPEAKARLVIFSWTGNRGGQGSAHNFMKPASPAWTSILASLEQFEVNFPGRGMRMKDALVVDSVEYAKDMAATLAAVLAGGKPCVFLGFSFGAILAFEVARLLQEKRLGPLAVFVVSAEGPSWPDRQQLGLAKLSEADFEKVLREKGGTDFILKDEGMKKMYVPVINADCKLEETYVYNCEAPLQCPVHVFFGRKEGHDKMRSMVSKESAELWLQATACKTRSSVQALDSDWYVFQDPACTEGVATSIADLVSARLS